LNYTRLYETLCLAEPKPPIQKDCKGRRRVKENKSVSKKNLRNAFYLIIR